MTFKLVLADDKEIEKCRKIMSSEGVCYTKYAGIEKDPLAVSERGVYRSYDHVHLSLFSGSRFVQWYGRGSSGYHYPMGRIMKIVKG